jgi:hypothetical protein
MIHRNSVSTKMGLPVGDLAGSGKSALEESGEEADARKSEITGGTHVPGPQVDCSACLTVALMVLTPYEFKQYYGAWGNWHRASMYSKVPLEVIETHWRKKADE